ncbi:MAG TPA: immunoglobulin domain-containing protein [Verrucomicrobiae bacterium]
MNRRPCRPRFATALLVLILGAVAGPVRAAEYRAFWVDGWGAGFLSQSQVDALLGVPGTTNKGTLRDANCNMVIVQVRRRADVCYPSGVGEPYMSGLSPANFNALAAMIKAAHDTTGGKKRIEVHCWSVVFKTGKGVVYSEHSDPANPDNYWPTRLGSTTGEENADGAFDPGHPKALQYLVNAHMDLVNFQTTAGPGGTDGGIDGIHYDYIRFERSDEGFNPISVARYNERYGLTGEPASSSEQFKEWRRDQVSAFARQMYARIQKTKPWIKQSGAFVTWNPSPTASTRAAFQATRPYYDVYSDWDSWMQEGLFDMAVPMTYYNWASLPNDYTRWMNYEKDRHGNRHMIIGPGTYQNSLANAILQLQMTRDPSPAGKYAQGFSGYSYRVPYASGTWAGFSPSLLAQVTPNWDDVPILPWKTSPTNGHIMGVVTLAGSGAWADHATVSLTGPVHRSQWVDGTGFYAFIDLPPGGYTVTASKAGYPSASASVTVAIGAVTGNMYERNLVLNATAPPAITADPQDATVIAGATATFTVAAAGAMPLAYQWRFNGVNLNGATTSQLVLSNVQINQAGGYSVLVTNSHGDVTSRVAALTVNPAFAFGGLRQLWSLAPGSRPYLTTGTTTPAERGLACNPVTRRLVLISRTNPTVYVLDADTGADRWTLDTTGVTGGYNSAYYLLMVGVAEDGAVYAGNLTLSGGSVPFKLYRWANDNAATVPTMAFAGDPGAGNSQRWGDTLDVRGSGTNTQVILASRSGNVVALLTTADGTNFTSKLITVADAPTGAFGLGLAFGSDNTFWGKATSHNLRQVRFDLVSGTGAVLRSHATPDFPGSVAPIGVSPTPNLLGGINVGTTGNHFRLYDLTPTNGTPVFLASTNFASDNDNTGSGTGSVDFCGDRVYALGANNGLLALQVLPATPPVAAPAITLQPQDQTVTVGQSASFSVTATGTEPLAYQWRRNGAVLPGATASSFTKPDVQLSDAGSYSVVVSNAAGSVTSSNALLTVNQPPVITTQPQSVTVNQGGNATFTVAATGTEPLTYQWNLGGFPIADATDSQLTITNVRPADAGSYSVDVINVAGQVTSSNATLGVNVPPVIEAHPQSQSVKWSSNATFTVTASGTAPLAYQWQFNGGDIPDATGSRYTRANAQDGDAGEYTVTVTNVAGAAFSQPALLTVIPPQPARFEAISKLADGRVYLQWTGEPGWSYQLQAATNLNFPGSPVLGPVSGSNGVFEFVDDVATNNTPQRFYRLRL